MELVMNGAKDQLSGVQPPDIKVIGGDVIAELLAKAETGERKRSQKQKAEVA